MKAMWKGGRQVWCERVWSCAPGGVVRNQRRRWVENEGVVTLRGVSEFRGIRVVTQGGTKLAILCSRAKTWDSRASGGLFRGIKTLQTINQAEQPYPKCHYRLTIEDMAPDEYQKHNLFRSRKHVQTNKNTTSRICDVTCIHNNRYRHEHHEPEMEPAYSADPITLHLRPWTEEHEGSSPLCHI